MSTTTEPVSYSPHDKGYVKPDVLVTTDWVAQHLNDPKVRILESDEDVLLYDLGPHPGRAEDRLARRSERPGRARLRVEGAVPGAAARGSASTSDTTVVFYGDKNNWWATYAFWVFQLFGFTNAKVIDGGRREVGDGRTAVLDRGAEVSGDAVHRRPSATTRRSARSRTRC